MKSKNKYDVGVVSLREVHELPGAWTAAHFISLLEQLDYDDAASTPADELKDTAIMALTDLEAEEAAEVLLELRFRELLTKGQRQNLAEELKDDRIWEQYPRIDFHEELFNVSCMLNWAFPRKFPTPDVVQIKLEVKALNDAAISNLEKPSASFIARLLNEGMNDHNLIYRLFDEKVASNDFPEAENIIWIWESEGIDGGTKSSKFTIYTSWNWVDELKGVKSYESTAFADGQLN